MKRTLRLLALTASVSAGMAATAQTPYNVVIAGTVTGCTPDSYVNIVSHPGTQPAIDIDVSVLPPNCMFSVTLNVSTVDGGFTLTTSCLGAIQTQDFQYTIDPLQGDSTGIYVLFNCSGNTNPDCLGLAGGTALPGTACVTAFGTAGTWDANCGCVADSTSCNACFTAAQTGANPDGGGGTPWSMSLSNCTSGGAAPYTFLWELPDGSTSTMPEPTYVFSSAGVFDLCLTIADASGCTSTTCDSVLVDANGGINGSTFFDCLQIPNGPNLPGTPCQIPDTILTGTWGADCVCNTDSISSACAAGFFVMQAYQWVDSASNPNGGGGEPIPNELWIWNLSSGGTGIFQYLWNFGDGSSSTEEYPTHTYASSGTYQLCLTISDNAGCADTYCQSITVDSDGIYNGLTGGGSRSTFTIRVMNPLSTGVDEVVTFSNVNTWPNPVNDVLNLTLQSRLQGTVSATITDLSGRVVTTTSLGVNGGSNRITLPVADLKAGLYVISISNGSTFTSERFVKVN